MNSSFDGFEVFQKGAIRVIRLNQPALRNPLSIEVIEGLSVSVAEAEQDRQTNHCVITGSGGSFASGANLKEVMQLDAKSARGFGLRGRDLMNKIAGSSLTFVAAIDGLCMGGALDLAIACDKRIASSKSKFAHPGAKLGIITGWGGTQMLPKLVGRKNALELILTAKTIGTREALRIGLIDRVSDEPLEEALNTLEIQK